MEIKYKTVIRQIESNMEAYTLPYVKQIASGNLLYEAGSSNLVLYDNIEGCSGVGWEGGDIYIPMADSCCCMAETNKIL